MLLCSTLTPPVLSSSQIAFRETVGSLAAGITSGLAASREMSVRTITRRSTIRRTYSCSSRPDWFPVLMEPSVASQRALLVTSVRTRSVLEKRSTAVLSRLLTRSIRSLRVGWSLRKRRSQLPVDRRRLDSCGSIVRDLGGYRESQTGTRMFNGTVSP